MSKLFLGILVEKIINALIKWLERYYEKKSVVKERAVNIERAKEAVENAKKASDDKDVANELNKLP